MRRLYVVILSMVVFGMLFVGCEQKQYAETINKLTQEKEELTAKIAEQEEMINALTAEIEQLKLATPEETPAEEVAKVAEVKKEVPKEEAKPAATGVSSKKTKKVIK